MKTKLAINFLKKLLHWADFRAGAERVNLDLFMTTYDTSCGAERVKSIKIQKLSGV